MAETSHNAGSRWRTLVGAGLLLTSLVATDAWSFALGRARVLSAIGEPLRVAVDLPSLSKEEAETLAVSVATPAAFQAAGLEYKPLLSNLKIEIEYSRDGSARLKLQGSQAVNEAYVDLLLQASWKGGEVIRDYTLLLGPAAAAMPPAPDQPIAASIPEPRRAAATPLQPLGARASAEQTTATAARTVRKPAPEPVTPSTAAVEATPTRAAPAPTEPVTAAPAQGSGTAPVAATAATAATPPTPAETPVAAAPASPSAPAIAQAPARAPTAAAPAQPAASESQWLTQPTLLAAVALLLAGLAGALVWQRKRQQKLADTNESAPDLAGVGMAAGMSVDTAKAQGPVSSMMYSPSQLEASGEIDPIAEADVYLAYGRVQQAEEILRDALRTHPLQASLYLKLLEIAVQRQDHGTCTTLMDQLSDLTRRQGPDWNTASELVARLRTTQPETDPAPPEETRTAPVIAPAVMAATAASLASTPAEPDQAGPIQDLPVLDLSLVADSVRQQTSEPALVPEPAADESSQAAPIELDFDLSVSAPEPEAAAAVPDLDFEPAPEPAEPASAPAPQPPAADMSLDFDLDISSPEPAPTATSQPTESETAASDNSLEFSLDLDQIGNASPPEPAPGTAPAPGPARQTEQEFMLDFELAPENKADELSDLVVSEDNSASDPLATQLELAQEFLALGDADGARSLAERVLARATGDLQARARALLDRLEAARPQ